MPAPDTLSAPAPNTPGVSTYLGLALTTFSTLMLEILLSRIFSVTTWYHFAFVAISVAMFGMTAGSLIVYLAPSVFRAERAPAQMAWSAIGFAVSMVVCFIIQLHIPFLWPSGDTKGIVIVSLTYAVISLPFAFSGICVCLALTRFPGRVSRLYGADLAGAALGCIAIIKLLDAADGPSAVIVTSAIAALGAACFAWAARSKPLHLLSVGVLLALTAFSAAQLASVSKGAPLVKLLYLKGKPPVPALYEKWNSFSRIDVIQSETGNVPFGWGMSTAMPPQEWVGQYQLRIDTASATWITHFTGDLHPLRYLKWDMVNMVHHLRENADVAVVGMGGGRDILSALVFGQKSVLAVEINRNIMRAVDGAFGDFSGHLDRIPNVTVVNDEARSFLTRTDKTFDIIQVSLIDTWAATAAGAFVMTESSLYTREAWDIFFSKLRPRGILTFSHWYLRKQPGAMYRLTALAASALQARGVENPRGHIMICRRINNASDPSVHYDADAPEGLGTILVSPDPFSAEDVAKFEAVCKQMNFDRILTPDFAVDGAFAALANGKNIDQFTRNFPINITPPTDDRPFFFNMLWLHDALDRAKWKQGGLTHNMEAVAVLGVLLTAVFIMTALCIVVPLAFATRRGSLRGAASYLLYFGAIGLGFMTIEIALMQRFNLFLGHPIYGLAVVLFGLLVSSSAGSLFVERYERGRTLSAGHEGSRDAAQIEARDASSVGAKSAARSGAGWLCVLVGAVAIFGFIVPAMTHAFAAQSTPLRIALACATLLPLGFCMGMPFALGMSAAQARKPELGPWLWGINGAASVCGSVLAVAISLSLSIGATYWTGLGCYAVALAAYMLFTRR